ncbi:tetratricopeptide repeat protein [uncultured Nostoc sp.]|uniref:tetratricopeptide repeat protein n=1 Tax=uncultured Nostoc sp. TaxID=340711 RepID=UPI0035CC82B2
MDVRLTQEQIEYHNYLYKQGCKFIQEEFLLGENKSTEKDNLQSQEKLFNALNLFEQVLKINPNNWSAMWCIGKIYQRVEILDIAFNWFEKAYLFKPDNADISREACICAIGLANSKAAIFYGETALKINPNDVGLLSNLSLAYLKAGRINDAKDKAQKALNINSRNSI